MDKNSRKKFLVLPSFQLKWISRFLLLVTFATLLSYISVISYIHWLDKKEPGVFFYVTDQFGSDPLTYRRSRILMPPILLSGGISLLITFIFSLLYSHKLAGPIFRLKRELEILLEDKDLTRTFQLREGDDLDDLVLSLNRTFQNLRQRIKKEDKNREELAAMAKKLLEEFTHYDQLPAQEAKKIALIKSLINRLQMPSEPLKV